MRNNRFPISYRKMNENQKLSWLDSPACRECVNRDQIECERFRLMKESAGIAKLVPSSTWHRDYRNGAPFPPKANNFRCQMRRATKVLIREDLDRLYPADYVSLRGADFDVQCASLQGRVRFIDADYLEREPVNLAAIDRALAKQRPLKSEDVATLKRVITRYEAKRRGESPPVYGRARAEQHRLAYRQRIANQNAA